MSLVELGRFNRNEAHILIARLESELARLKGSA